MNPYNQSPYAPPGAVAPPYPMDVQTAAPGSPGAVSEIAVEMLRQTRPWVMFLGILCFIGAALMLVGGLLYVGMGAVAGSSMAGSKSSSSAMLGALPAVMGLVYLVMAGVYVYPGLKLWGYGSTIGRLVASRSATDLETALLHQKSFWKYSGIMTIVLIAFYVVLFFVVIAVSVSAMHS
jgi:hypothetical protein